MKISELRYITKMSQCQFAEHFGIPVGTLRNWEQGIANPPKYVFQMIFTSMRRDKMINVETIKFVRLLDELAELSRQGIEPFENANETTFGEKIFYDNRVSDEDGGYKVVLDACILDDPECYHHDIVSYYADDSLEYKVKVNVDEESAYVTVKLLISEDLIIIEDGAWYFA